MRPLPPRPGTGTKNTQFQIEQWDGDKTGEKIILYGETGMGKTTLASMAPDPVFIGLDDGGRKLRHPKTGELLQHIPNINTFEDIRGAASACLDLDCKTVVIDTGTVLESLAEAYVLKTVSGPQNSVCKNLEGYGYGKGYKHLYDTMRLPLLDFDKLIAAGKNVIVICQSVNSKIANPAGEDYLCNEPRLYHSRLYSVLLLWCEWTDHIFRIDYQGTWVKKRDKKEFLKYVRDNVAAYQKPMSQNRAEAGTRHLGAQDEVR